MHPRRGTDMLSAWLLVVLGAALLLVGTIGLVEALVRGDWTEALVTAVLLLVVGFGVSRGVGQLRRARPTRELVDLPASQHVLAAASPRARDPDAWSGTGGHRVRGQHSQRRPAVHRPSPLERSGPLHSTAAPPGRRTRPRANNSRRSQMDRRLGRRDRPAGD